jgi:hypothetical protein
MTTDRRRGPPRPRLSDDCPRFRKSGIDRIPRSTFEMPCRVHALMEDADDLDMVAAADRHDAGMGLY